MKQTPLQQDPAIYLREQPSPTSPCHVLVEMVGSHDGAPAPMHMIAKLAVRLHQVVDWMTRWDGRERFARRAAAALAALALANIGVVVKSWLNAHDARIVAEAESRAAEKAEIEYRKGVKEQLDRIDRDIRDIQRALRRIGAVPLQGDISIGQTGGPSWFDSSY